VKAALDGQVNKLSYLAKLHRRWCMCNEWVLSVAC